MEWFEAIILGLLQGLTEFLPVSSSTARQTQTAVAVVALAASEIDAFG